MILLVCTKNNLFITELYIDNIQSWTVQFVALENKYELLILYLFFPILKLFICFIAWNAEFHFDSSQTPCLTG